MVLKEEACSLRVRLVSLGVRHPGTGPNFVVL